MNFEHPTQRGNPLYRHKISEKSKAEKAPLEIHQVRLGKKLAATYSPAGVQYHRRGWA